MNPDLEFLSQALSHVEQRAQKLPWAKTRPWKTTSHIWLEHALPTIDFHDLGQSLAKEVLDTVVLSTEQLESGAVMLITGAGRHSLGNHAAIKTLVGEHLRELAQEREWEFSPRGPGRFILVFDPDRAPPSATGKLGWGFWVITLLFLAALVTALMAD